MSKDMSAQEQLGAADQQRLDGNYDEAIVLYRGILEATEDFTPARHGLGLALVYKGEFDEGLQELTRATELDPDLAKYELDLGKTYLMLGMVDEGKASMTRVLELDPDNDEARKQLSYF